MGMIYIFNKLKWKPPVATKNFTVPELELNLAYPDDEIKPMPDKQRKVFDAKFNSGFDSKFQTLSADKIKKVQEAIKWTESKLEGKSKAEAEELVSTANKLLKQAFDTWQAEIQKLCDECVMKAYEESVKAMKMKLVKAQIKSIAKIVIIGLLILTAAGLAIAATVVTGGALAPIILGAIATGAGALWKVYKLYDSEWANSSNKIKEIEADIKKLDDAIKSYKKLETTYAGTSDKLKAFKAALTAPVGDIEKHVGQLDKYIFEMQKTLKDQKAKLLELQAKTKDAKSGDVDNSIKGCIASIDKASDQLKAIEEAKTSAKEIKAQYAAAKVPDFGKLNTVVVKLQANSGTVSTVGTNLKSCFTSLKKIGVAIG